MDDHPPRPWPLADGEGLRDELLAAYAEPSRRYHDTRHLAGVLGRLDELRSAGVTFEREPVLLAAWFHDAVYDGERDAEERSAAWAEAALPAVVDGATVAEVARLVRVTETHDPADDDRNGCALSDADMGVLALDERSYDDYADAVRAEYSHLDDGAYREGRTAFLEGLAQRDRIFRTDHARKEWEDRARHNIERELERLRA
jgi:predicted metal-dependent HD superfamily phosphohydrolase